MLTIDACIANPGVINVERFFGQWAAGPRGSRGAVPSSVPWLRPRDDRWVVGAKTKSAIAAFSAKHQIPVPPAADREFLQILTDRLPPAAEG